MLIRIITRFQEPALSCVWFPDGQTCVTGSLDRLRSLWQEDVAGHVGVAWNQRHLTECLAISHDGSKLIAGFSRTIWIYNSMTRALERSVDLEGSATSLSISRDSEYCLVLVTHDSIMLIDIDTGAVTRRYEGSMSGDYLIRARFGGLNDEFVVSGSEGLIKYLPIWKPES